MVKPNIIDEAVVKPLDGAPLMSVNCWNTVLDILKTHHGSQSTVRCLEWGAGNSTISLVKTGMNLDTKFEFISIDHETKFFPWLAEAVLEEFSRNGKNAELEVSWRPLVGPIVKLAHVKDLLRERNTLKSSSLTWQILLDNKRLQYISQFEPNYGFSIRKIVKQSVKLLILEVAYWLWLVKGILRSLRHDSAIKAYKLAPITFAMKHGEIRKNLFIDYFKKSPVAGCLRIQSGGVSVELWHIPKLDTSIEMEVLLDGPIKQLADYVSVPLTGKFDIIFIDGRARVSCVKRVYHDQLLNKDGYLFVHDAFRSEMGEAFSLFSSIYQFINGSNQRLNQQELVSSQSGFPLINAGDSLGGLQWEIIQELFVYQNTYENTSS